MSLSWEQAPKPLRNAHDPTVALILWSVLFIATLGSILTIPFDFSVADMLPAFGGVIVLLGSYFAARTLGEGERDKATQMLASTSAAVRVAGVHRLGEVAKSVPRYRQYVRATLEAYGHEHPDDEEASLLASSILEQFPEPTDT
jgi:hypothetical protein